MISTIRRLWSAPIFACMLATLWLAGCATDDTAPAEDSAAADEDAAPAAPMPRAFFTNVEDGQTVDASFEIIFGVEDFTIAPVEDPPAIRDGEGHYHLAVDVDCIADGIVIPPGTPDYIHFGTGNDRITMQFEPGEHRLCLQVADGEHRVLVGEQFEGLTQEITVTVEEQ